MNLVEDYLRAVAMLLPKQQREDITAELREMILSRIEGREHELARPLMPEEVEGVLHEIGHPLVVAARYREGPQSIIGPALYPFWVFAVKTTLAIQACIIAVVFVVQVFSGDLGRAIGHAFANGITGAATTIGFLTVAGWIIERRAKTPAFTYKWRVKDLRFLELAGWDLDDWRSWIGTRGPERWREAMGGGAPAAASTSSTAEPTPAAEQRAADRRERTFARLRRRERAQAGRGFGVIMSAAVFLRWWTGLLHFGFSATPDAWRSIGVEPGAFASFDWAGLKAQVFWPVLAYTLVSIAWGFSLMARPFARRTHGALDIVQGAAMLAFVAWLAFTSPLAAAVGGDSVAGLALKVRDAVEGGPPFPLAAVAVVILACMALNGAARGLRGLWLVVQPQPDGWELRA